MICALTYELLLTKIFSESIGCYTMWILKRLHQLDAVPKPQFWPE